MHRPPLPPRKYSWYSFLLEAESIPWPQCDQKDFMSKKNPPTPAGIEPATFRFVARHINHCATAVPPVVGKSLYCPGYTGPVYVPYPCFKVYLHLCSKPGCIFCLLHKHNVQTGPGAHPASCKMGTGSIPGVKSGQRVKLTPHPLLVPWSRKSRVIPLLPLWAVKERPGRDADPSPHSKAVVKKE